MVQKIKRGWHLRINAPDFNRGSAAGGDGRSPWLSFASRGPSSGFGWGFAVDFARIEEKLLVTLRAATDVANFGAVRAGIRT
jgi:hypothetical protein